MAAEIYHIALNNGQLEGIQGRVVEDGTTFYATGYGDGSGLETFVRVRPDGVHIFKGTATPRTESEDIVSPFIEVRDHITTVKPGDQPHMETLIGPENNNEVLLSVKNIGETAARPYMDLLPIDTDPPLLTSFN